MRPANILRWVFLAAFLTFMLAPLFFIVVNSFNSAAYSVFPPPGFSLRWYKNLFEISDFWLAFRNSLMIAVMASLLALSVGTMLAFALVRGGWQRREMVQSLFMTPLMVPRIVIGIAAFIAAIKVGLYPSIISIVLVHSVLLLPYATSILVAAMMQVDQTQEEAARDLGAGPFTTFRKATLPQIKKGMLVALTLTFIISFDEFDISLFLTRTDNMVLPVRMFLYMQEQENPTMAAMSTFLLLLAGIFVFLILRLSKGANLLSLMSKGR